VGFSQLMRRMARYLPGTARLTYLDDLVGLYIAIYIYTCDILTYQQCSPVLTSPSDWSDRPIRSARPERGSIGDFWH
jgi:hypothetical protein